MNKIIIGLIVLAAGVLAGWYLLGTGNLKNTLPFTQPSVNKTEDKGLKDVDASTTPSTSIGTETGIPETTKGGVSERTVITYTGSGFNPRTVTVPLGTTVAFLNDSSKGMWVASDMHPTHQLLPGFDQLASVENGGSYEYTFTKAGTWTYHNHVNASHTGSVVVIK